MEERLKYTLSILLNLVVYECLAIYMGLSSTSQDLAGAVFGVILACYLLPDRKETE